MAYISNWETSGYFAEFSDPTDFGEVYQANQKFFNDSRSDSCKFVIFDLSGVKELNIDDNDLEGIAASDLGGSFSIQRLKVALVADDESVRSICQQYINLKRSMNSPWNYVIFDDIDSARMWVSSPIDKSIGIS